MDAQLKRCFSDARLNALQLKNRLIKAGTYEGLSVDGQVTDALVDFHVGLAKGGIAMTTIGYCAVENNGRIHSDMLYMHEGIRESLTDMIAQIHQAGAKVSGQMGHCGGFSKNKKLTGKRPKGVSFSLNMLGFAEGMLFTSKMTKSDIDAMVQAYYDAAVFMKSVGFDCVEIHFGHGYGLCQFMSPKTNRRKDEYGGSFENRMRLSLEVLAAVRQAVGDDFPIIGKISVTEGVRGGLHYDDAVEIAKTLDNAGIDGIITSGGTSTMNPMIMFRGDSALKPLIKAEKNTLMKWVLRLVGPAMFRYYPYKELYFLDVAKRIKAAVNCAVIYIGGASTNESFHKLMSENMDFVQLGRSLLANPELPNEAMNEEKFQSRCLHCNECIATIEHPDGIHCTRFV